MKIKTALETKAALKLVRRYVPGEFAASNGFDLRKISSGLPKKHLTKLQRYFDIINFKQTEPHIIVRPGKRNRTYTNKNGEVIRTVKDLNRKKIRSLQQFAQHEDYPSGLKIVFLPASLESNDVEIIWNKNKVEKVIQSGQTRYSIDFNKNLLLTDTENEIAKALNATDATHFMIQAGKHLIYNAASIKSSVSGNVVALMNNYSAENHDPDDTNSHYYGNWLNGVVGWRFDNIHEGRKFITGYTKERESLLQRRYDERKDLKNVYAKARRDEKRVIESKERKSTLKTINENRKKRGLKPLSEKDIKSSIVSIKRKK